MKILKRGCLAALALVISVMCLSFVTCEVSAHGHKMVENDKVTVDFDYPESAVYTGEELVERTLDSYQGAKKVTGFRGFNGRCSTLVNGTLVALGIRSEYHSCNGKEEYNLFENMDRTECGYDVIRYSAQEYDLEAALNAVSQYGTKDVHNIVVGWQGGRTGTSNTYGHTCFIQGIVDGMVYFCESYALEIGDTLYYEGEPIVCTIAEFAEYYNKWAFFEGIVHFDYPDYEAPELCCMETKFVSEHGFTLNFDAVDNMGIAQVYAKVWHYGQTEEDAVTIPATVVDGKCWLRVDTSDFGNFQGRYYVNCYVVDGKGNVSVIGMAEDGMALYQAEEKAGLYRVVNENAGIHNAPYNQVNDTDTREATAAAGTDLIVSGSITNDSGELWYLLSEGGWMYGNDLRQIYSWADIWNMIQEYLASVLGL